MVISVHSCTLVIVNVFSATLSFWHFNTVRSLVRRRSWTRDGIHWKAQSDWWYFSSWDTNLYPHASLEDTSDAWKLCINLSRKVNLFATIYELHVYRLLTSCLFEVAVWVGTTYFLGKSTSSNCFHRMLNKIPCKPLARIFVSNPRNMSPVTPDSAITLRATCG